MPPNCIRRPIRLKNLGAIAAPVLRSRGHPFTGCVTPQSHSLRGQTAALANANARQRNLSDIAGEHSLAAMTITIVYSLSTSAPIEADGAINSCRQTADRIY